MNLKIDWYDLERFARSPTEFEARMMTPESETDDTDTLNRVLGQAMAGVQENVQILDFADRRTKDYKNQAASAVSLGRTPILRHEAAALNKHLPLLIPQIPGQIALTDLPSDFEFDGLTFVPPRPLVTYISESGKQATIITRMTSDISTYPLTIFQAGYDRLAAWSTVCLQRTLTPDWSTPVFMVVVETRTHSRSAVWRLKPDDLQLALNELLIVVQRLKYAVKHGFQCSTTTPLVAERPAWRSVDQSVSQLGHQLWR